MRRPLVPFPKVPSQWEGDTFHFVMTDPDRPSEGTVYPVSASWYCFCARRLSGWWDIDHAGTGSQIEPRMYTAQFWRILRALPSRLMIIGTILCYVWLVSTQDKSGKRITCAWLGTVPKRGSALLSMKLAWRWSLEAHQTASIRSCHLRSSHKGAHDS